LKGETNLSDSNRSTSAAEEEIEIDLRQILKVLKKWRKLILIMTLLSGLSAAFISYFVMQPVYQAQTLLMVTQATDKLQTTPTQQTGQDGLDTVVNTVSRMPVLTMNTYLGQLKSEALMKRIITQLDLTGYTPGGLSGMITADIVKDSNLIEVKVTNGDPVMASRIADTMSDEYLKLMTEKNQEQMSRSITFLDNQTKITNVDLQSAVDDLTRFQSQPRGVAVLEAEFAKKSTDRVNFDSRLKTVGIEIQQVGYGVASLEQEVANVPQTVAVQKYNDANGSVSSFNDVNPLYVTLAGQLAEKKASLAEKQGESEGLQVLVDSMARDLDTLQAELAEKKATQDQLQRDVDRLKLTSETLTKKGTETQIAKSIDLGDTSVVVVSEATIPTSPVKPNKKLNIAIALILGLMTFTLLAFMLEYLDNTLKTPDDVARELDLPVLGLIPIKTANNSRESSYGGKA
jgi:succinoglycan biosynthesis transport protein ExoP